MKQPPGYSQPPFRKIREGRDGGGRGGRVGGDAKIRGTVKMELRQTGVNQRTETTENGTNKYKFRC